MNESTKPNNSPNIEGLFTLRGKKALITGGSGCIGGVLAVAMGSAGADVCLHGRDAGRLENAVNEVKATGVRAVAAGGDLTDVSTAKELVDETVEQLGGLDILVNCAATNRRKAIADVTEDDYDTIMAVNLKSVYFLSREAYLVMKHNKGGKVIHIGSINAHYGIDTVSVYGMAKGGIAQLTKVMAVEWAADNVQVNCLIPGFMYTPMSAPLWQVDDNARWFRSRIPMRRPGKPNELIGAFLLLASEASSYITGQNIVVDGGFLSGGSWLKDNIMPYSTEIDGSVR